MTGLAGHATGVIGNIDLRKGFGPGGAGGMAAGAEEGRVGFAGIDGGIVGMFGLGTMARLTVNVGVFAGALRLRDITVAGLAGLVSGEVNGMSGDLSNRGAAVVSILAEAPRNDKAARHEKAQGSDGEECGEAKEMPRILKRAHATFLERWPSNDCDSEGPTARTYSEEEKELLYVPAVTLERRWVAEGLANDDGDTNGSCCVGNQRTDRWPGRT